MPRESQFGVRKNPAPHARQHGSRLAAEIASETALVNQNLQIPESLASNSQVSAPKSPLHAAPQHAATVGGTPNQNHLLTVSEVANLLQVPVSWVYARTRKRSIEKIPGYRLGKYWRFDKAEVLDWVARHKSTREAA